MSAGEILLEQDEGIATLTIARPQRRNAMDEAQWHRLRSRLRELAQDPPRALILTGQGGHFCAGLDLNPDNAIFARLAPIAQRRDEGAARTLIGELKRVTDQLAGFSCPTIAAIQGACVGLGLELALACDLRVAARDALLSLPEVRLGMVPDLGGTVRLTRLVGRGQAARLALAAQAITGEEAWHIGLTELLAEAEDVPQVARDLALDIHRGAPAALQGTLAVIRRAPELQLQDALDEETAAGARAVISGEPLEAMMARQMGRKPSWVRS